MAKRFLALIGALAVIALAVLYLSVPALPPRYAPWAPLDVREKPLPAVTALKFSRALRSRQYCEAALATSEWRFTPLPKLAALGGKCEVEDAIRIEPANLIFSSGFSATCPLSLGLAMFVHQVVQPAARRHFDTDVTRLDHLGSFACRKIRGRSEDAGLSEHAGANAIDVTGFVLRDGRLVSLARAWATKDDKTQEALFLRDIRDGACGIFHTVLSPDYNQAHRSHFHFDMGQRRMCR